jgi:hypothetical protein
MVDLGTKLDKMLTSLNRGYIALGIDYVVSSISDEIFFFDKW